VRLMAVVPHFEPDLAPTGAVAARLVKELAARDHSVEVITSLPWYREHRIESGFDGRLVRHEDTPWGRITRVHPFPAPDKTNLVRRAASYFGFSSLAAVVGARGPGVDAVLAMSPPLTLGVTGRLLARRHRAPLVFNIQDVYPDIAIELGYFTNSRVIAATRLLERWCYDHADAVTVLSDDLAENVMRKTGHPERVRVIPNFVDTESLAPGDRENSYRREFGLSGKTVVMYAGNVGLSQSLETVLEAAAALAVEEDVVFVINGQGARRDEIERAARGLPNVVFVDMQPAGRLPEVLAAADIHLVPLKQGLSSSSVPSKTYSILAAGRPLVASVDRGSEVERVIDRSGAGIAVPPEDAEALAKALKALIDAPAECARMGAAGRAFVEAWASPAAVAQAYEALFEELRESHETDGRGVISR
jgi:putative colanic acid biosynthesis glycosyltransferase WcaI